MQIGEANGELGCSSETKSDLFLNREVLCVRAALHCNKQKLHIALASRLIRS